MAPARKSWRHLIVAVAVLSSSVISDQWTKHWAENTLRKDHGGQMQLVAGRFAFTYAQNPGAAWGFLAKSNESFRKPFFFVVSLIAFVFIGTMLWRVEQSQWLLLIALSSILSGAIGNFIDRLKADYVVDFIDVHITSTFRWPTFNIADIAITAGVLLMLLDMLLAKKRPTN